MRFAAFLVPLLLLCAGPAYALSKNGLVMYLSFDDISHFSAIIDCELIELFENREGVIKSSRNS
jgi:hypothetical protein